MSNTSRPSLASSTSHLIIFISSTALIIDQIFKALAVQRLPEDGGRLRFPIDFALHKNYGIAFDLPVPLWMVIPLTALILIFLVREIRLSQSSNRVLALSLIAAGAVGNLIDRIIYGFTVDYVILFGRSAINMADVMIFIGVALLFIKRVPRPE